MNPSYLLRNWHKNGRIWPKMRLGSQWNGCGSPKDPNDPNLPQKWPQNPNSQSQPNPIKWIPHICFGIGTKMVEFGPKWHWVRSGMAAHLQRTQTYPKRPKFAPKWPQNPNSQSLSNPIKWIPSDSLWIVAKMADFGPKWHWVQSRMAAHLQRTQICPKRPKFAPNDPNLPQNPNSQSHTNPMKRIP